MIDDKLVALVRETKAKIDAMKGDRPSKKMMVREEFANEFLRLLGTAHEDISDTDKIAAFDEFLEIERDGLSTAVARSCTGKGYYRDDDDDHYVYEAVVKAVFGPQIFDAINALESLLPSRD